MNLAQERKSDKPKEIFSECEKCEGFLVNFECSECKSSKLIPTDIKLRFGYPLNCPSLNCKTRKMFMECPSCLEIFDSKYFQDSNFTSNCPKCNCKFQSINCQFCGENQIEIGAGPFKLSSGSLFNCNFCKKLSTIVRCVSCGYLNQLKGKLKQGEVFTCQYEFCKQKWTFADCPDCKKPNITNGEYFTCKEIACKKKTYKIAACSNPRCYSATFCPKEEESKMDFVEFVCSGCKKKTFNTPCSNTSCKKLISISVECLAPDSANTITCSCKTKNFIFSCNTDNCKAITKLISSSKFEICSKCNTLPKEIECTICNGGVSNRVFPCGHMTCGKCLTKIKDCPHCRKAIQSSIILT